MKAALGKQLFAVSPNFFSVTFIVGIGIMAFYHEPGKSSWQKPDSQHT
jgi:hypothetical protein